jgi:hypothetical protein
VRICSNVGADGLRGDLTEALWSSAAVQMDPAEFLEVRDSVETVMDRASDGASVTGAMVQVYVHEICK